MEDAERSALHFFYALLQQVLLPNFPGSKDELIYLAILKKTILCSLASLNPLAP